MKKTKLSQLFSLKRRYYRSVNLERDLESLDAVNGYVLTERSAGALKHLFAAFAQPKANRAWTLTGVYGTGKSAFAHYLANLCGPQDTPNYHEALAIAMGVLDEEHPILATLSSSQFESGLFRAITTGQREPLSWTVVRALAFGADLLWTRGRKPEVVRQLTDWRVEIDSGKCSVTDQQVLKTLKQISETAKQPILLIIDELGKNLEYAAQHLGTSDLYLLQQIAELKQSEDYPIYFLGLLHQTFEGYGERLSTVEQQEWNKIQGRFEDISFRELPSQMTRLIGRVIDRSESKVLDDDLQRQAQDWDSTLQEVYAENEVSASVMAQTYPLHPLAALILPRLCLQYAQNDRSLFTFLTSDEPYAFKTFLNNHAVQKGKVPTLQLHHLYDYFVESVTGLASRFNLQRWVEIQGLIEDAREQDPTIQKLLKSIGILNLVTSTGSLRATPHLVALSLCDHPQDSKALKTWQSLIQSLRAKGLITHRSALDELRLWQGSDFDIEVEIQTQIEKDRQSLANLLAITHPLKPAVAQRHYLEFGTLRLFEQRYVDRSTCLAPLTCSDPSQDGLILYWMDTDEPEQLPAMTEDGKPVLLIRPQHLDLLHIRSQHLHALRCIQKNSAALSSDGVARREVKQRLIEAERLLDETLQQIFAWRGEHHQCWVTGESETIQNAKAFQTVLSNVCDMTYDSSLTLDNELINRRQLTSQGAKARREVIEAMLSGADQACLGFSGYGPEVAIYFSVLEATGIHQFNGDEWEIVPPHEDSGVFSVWECIEKFCFQARDHQQSVDYLYTQLSKPPYGVKQGVIPVLFAAYLLHHVDDIGLYKDGTFVPVLGPEHFEIFVRDPARFAVKYFEVVGLRSEVFKELEHVLRSPKAKVPAGVRNPSLLMVAKPLFNFVRTLPKFTVQTKRISPSAQNVIKVLQTAQEPDELLFRSLPKACGLPSIETDQAVDLNRAKEFRKQLVQCLHEIQTARDVLLSECHSYLYEAFSVRQKKENLREDLRARSSYLMGQCLEPVLKRFLIAAADDQSSDQDWLEALVMIVADKPSKSWSDDDLTRFEIALSDLVRRFQNLEALQKEVQARGGGFEAQRITATEPNGHEINEVLWVDENDKPILDEIINEILEKSALRDNPKLKRAFAARLINKVLKDETQLDIADIKSKEEKKARQYG